MTTTIAVSESSRDKLTMLKVEEGYKNMDALVSDLIIEHNKNKFIKESKMFRKRMDDKGLDLEDLIE